MFYFLLTKALEWTAIANKTVKKLKPLLKIFNMARAFNKNNKLDTQQSSKS